MLENLKIRAEIKTENFDIIENNLVEKIKANFLEAIGCH